jgi:hypothetical protein
MPPWSHDEVINFFVEEHPMRPGVKFTTVLLGILGLADLATVPFMIAAHHHNAGEPPMPAIVAEVIIGIATLASAVGLRQGRRWAFGVAITCRILDSISAILGLQVRPSSVLAAVGGVTLVLSVAAIVLLVRVQPGRAARRAASAGAAGDRQPEPSGRPALKPNDATSRHGR